MSVYCLVRWGKIVALQLRKSSWSSNVGKGVVQGPAPLYEEAFFFSCQVTNDVCRNLSKHPVSVLFLKKILDKNWLTMVCFRNRVISNIQRFVFPV